ncbi:MAG: ATP-binding protein [Planctomycetes bacterium]|nr:ATP-binding protein [Planctomycetota bacterium]
MARADLIRRLFESYQGRDDEAFRSVASEIIEEERKKQHPVLANELKRILVNGNRSMSSVRSETHSFEAVPTDGERKTPLLSVRTPDRYLDDLILAPDLRRSLDRIVEEFCDWDVLEANGLWPTRRILFCGPSGCGKTASAEALSSELGLPLLYVRFDSVVSSLLGETAANLRKVFDYASRGQWVIFFDEFDAIGRSRDDATEHGEIKRVVNSFLQLLDGFGGRSLIIAATNFAQVLDPAIWRRFDDVLRFDLPDTESLRSLLKLRLRQLQTRDSQVAEIASSLIGATFADAERVTLDIRKSCAMRGRTSVQSSDVSTAIERYRYRRNVLVRESPQQGRPSVDQD